MFLIWYNIMYIIYHLKKSNLKILIDILFELNEPQIQSYDLSRSKIGYRAS